MSLMSDLKAAKSKLKSTQTVRTELDGRKYLESTTSSSRIEVGSQRFGFVVDTKPDNVPAKITEQIYLGSQDCCDEKVLNDYNIKYVLSVGIEAPLQCNRVNYKYVECLDLPEFELDTILEQCVEFLRLVESEDSKVLVHCNAGVSRAASVVIGYLIKARQLTYLDAYNIVKSARSCIQPNAGFVKQLQQLGKS